MNAANRKGGITVQLSQGDGLDDAVSFSVASGTLAVRAANVLRFGPGITAQSLRLEYRAGRNGFGWGPHLAYGDQNDAIAITSGGWDDTSNSRLHPFDEMQFADGSKMDWSELEALGLRLDLAKYPGESTRVSGSEFRDIIIGTDAHHVIHASGGDDWIDAGTGDNSIYPGKGSDTVLFGQGSGRDRVLSTRDDRADGDMDSVQFKAGIAPADLLFLRLGDNLIVKIKGSTDILTVVDAYAGNPIDHVRFDDGTRIAFTALPIASAKDEATTGADTINLAPTGETVDALAGDDIVYGEAGNDVIHGGPGIDKLYGGAGDDILEDSDGAYFWGGDGNDTIRGRAIDTNAVSVDAGPGNDVLDVIARRILLGTGNDTLILRAAANELTVIADGATQAGDIRTVRFSAGIASSSVTAHFAGDDLLIACSDVERLEITGAANLEAGTQQGYIFIFDDSPSTIWTYQRIFRMASTPTAGNDGLPGTPDADVIDGLDGNDVIHGRSGNDILRGSGGHDILYGGDGNDILIAGTGDDDLYGGDGDDILYASTGATGFFGGLGSDTFRIGKSGTHVIESESRPEKDVIEFEFGVFPQDIVVRRQLSILDHAALTISNGGTVIIKNFFAKNSLDGVQEVRFLSAPETVWTAEQLREMAIMGTTDRDIIFGFDFRNDFIAAGGGDDRIYGRGGDDILDAGPGNDILDGSSGDDTYIYRLGFGQDVIFDNEGFDTLKLDDKISTAEVSLFRVAGSPPNHFPKIAYFSDGDYLVVAFDRAGSNHQIWINSFFNPSGNAVETIQFEDGTTWSLQDIKARTVTVTGIANAQSGTAADDIYTVDNGDDTVTEVPDAGTDTINSVVSFRLPDNVENLNLTGKLNASGRGNDLSNIITGNSGDNIMDGYMGFKNEELQRDTLIGGAGNDLYSMKFLAKYIPADSWEISTAPLVNMIEKPDEGMDTLETNHFRVQLPENIENLTLTENNLNTVGVRSHKGKIRKIESFVSYSQQDEDEDDRSWYFGNSQNNVIDASKGGYSRFGYLLNGGPGADTLIGGDGNTWYEVNDTNDTIIETDTSNFDFITSSSISLAAVKNIEILELTGTQALSLTGDTGNNDLRSSKNTSINILTGLDGDDRYFVDLNDRVIESEDGGNDWVIIDIVAAGSAALHTAHKIFQLSEYAHVENIAANGHPNWNRSTQARAGVHLVGNTESNVVSGSFHDDIVEGGAGNDVVEDMLMSIYPSAFMPGDTDQLHGGDGDDHLISWSGNDRLDGGPGDDVLDGGSGNDILDGGPGNDVVLFGNGDGQDTWSEALVEDDQEKLNVLRFKPGVQVADVALARRGTGLEIRIQESEDRISVIDFHGHDGALHANNPLQRIEFADGTQWDLEKIQALAAVDTPRTHSIGSPSPQYLPAGGSQILLDHQVQDLVNAMAAFSPAAAGHVTPTASHLLSPAAMIAANWQ